MNNHKNHLKNHIVQILTTLQSLHREGNSRVGAAIWKPLVTSLMHCCSQSLWLQSVRTSHTFAHPSVTITFHTVICGTSTLEANIT